MRFTARRFLQKLRNQQRRTRRLKRKGSKTRRVRTTKKQKGGGNTLTRTLPPSAVITDPGAPPREMQDPSVEGALD